MRGWQAWAIAAGGLVLALGVASIPWSLDTDRLADRLNGAFAPRGYHWERPTSAQLRLFPEPILDVFGLRLADGAGKVVFTASTAALRLSIPSLLAGQYVMVRARLKEPAGALDLDKLAEAFPDLAQSSPAGTLQARGGQLRITSARFGLDETIAPINGALSWAGRDKPLHVVSGGVWRGRWTDVDATVTAPAELIGGGGANIKLSVAAAGAKAAIEGDIALGDIPAFSGKFSANAPSLADLANWLQASALGAPDEAVSGAGKISLAADLLNFEEGQFTYKGQTFEGAVGLQRGAKGWSASATLAADRLDLTSLFGPMPSMIDEFGRWSRAPLPQLLPSIDLDMRLSATSVSWGSAHFSDAAVAITQHGDETTVKVLDGGFAGGIINGVLIAKDCARRCATKATLTLANADAGELSNAIGKPLATGLCTVDLDVSVDGDSPESLIDTAEGELALTIRDGAILGVNFEEALRRGQRRTVDLSRDLFVGQTEFRKLEGKFYLADGAAQTRDLRLSGPGVQVTAAGAIDVGAQSFNATIEAKQADAIGHVSVDGASLGLRLSGPWMSRQLEVEPPQN